MNESEKAMKWTVIWEPKHTIMCLGVFDDYHTALGYVIDQIMEEKKGINNTDAAWYKVGDVYDLSDDAGYGIETRHKAECWESESVTHWYILETSC